LVCSNCRLGAVGTTILLQYADAEYAIGAQIVDRVQRSTIATGAAGSAQSTKAAEVSSMTLTGTALAFSPPTVTSALATGTPGVAVGKGQALGDDVAGAQS
jgi:hypothetical protein